MRKFKKFLAVAMTGAMMLGLATAAMPTTNLYAAPTPAKSIASASNEIFAKARTTTDTPTGPSVTVSGAAIDVKINYATYTATLTSESNDIYAFVDVYKSKKNKTTQKEEVDWNGKPSSSSYKFNGKTVTIDLSFLKLKSLQGIEISGDKSMAKVQVELQAQPAKLKNVKYADGKFTYKEGKNTVDLPDAGYEYRGEYATTWTPLSEFGKTEHISAEKTTIYIRAIVNNAPAGAEAKVAIDKAAAGPKISIDYIKDTIDLKKTSEISLDGDKFISDGIVQQDGTKKSLSALNGKVTPKMIRDTFAKDGTTAFTVFVRTAKTDKKPESSVVRVVIPAITKLTPGTTTLVTSGSAITDVLVASDASDNTQKVTATFNAGTGKSPKPYYEFKVGGTASFEYTIVGARKETWATLTSSKTAKINLTDKPQTLRLRKSGTTVKKGGSDAFPSEEIKITIPAKPAN